MRFTHFLHLLMLLSAIATGSLAFSAENNSTYHEAVHVRFDGKTLIAPEVVLIEPSAYKEFALAIELNDDFKYLTAHDGKMTKLKDAVIRSSEMMRTTLVCDQPIYFNRQSTRSLQINIRKTRPGNPTLILLSPKTKACGLVVRYGKLESKITLKTSANAFAFLNQLNQKTNECTQIKSEAKNSVLNAFASFNNEQTTCTYPIRSVQNLENKIDGLQGKMTALLGQPLSKEFLALKDPYAALDFSKAPQLDAILLSALVFRADYSGVLIARAMEYHAARGTQVRILVADVISLIKDKALFDRMMSTSANIKVQLYEWNKVKGAGSGSILSEFHRTVHSKLFITLSATDRKLDTVIHGGRNVHDGFALGTSVSSKDTLDPYVIYGAGGDESWASWRDFEVKIQEPDFVEAVAQHFLHLWNRDARTNVIAPIQKTTSANVLEESNFPYAMAKHMMSVPFQDGYRLEKLYVKMIDSAREEIVITTPYLRPPKPVFEALLRATQRGVKLKIITRIDLQGDTFDDLLEEVNKSSINSLFDKSDVYEYTVKGEILHSKLTIIDRKLSFVSSVNLNHRSYLHDIEDGMLIYSPAYTAKLLAVVKTYESSVRLVTEKVKTVWWRKLIVDALKDVF
jgi:cardiolipin synthase